MERKRVSIKNLLGKRFYRPRSAILVSLIPLIQGVLSIMNIHGPLVPFKNRGKLFEKKISRFERANISFPRNESIFSILRNRNPFSVKRNCFTCGSRDVRKYWNVYRKWIQNCCKLIGGSRTNTPSCNLFKLYLDRDVG